MLLALFLGCGSDNSVSPTFAGGDFDFYTENVLDECLGVALEALFMPEGPATPHAFEYPIYVPSYEELPVSYDVDFRDPFVGMPVTVEDGGDGWFAIRGSVMEAVELDAVKYGDCVVTMTVDADLKPETDDEVAGQGRIDISDPRGSEDLCPVFDTDPCRVTLQLTAKRR